MLAGSAWSQPSTSAGWNYEVRQGDTLIDIAKRYLLSASDWVGVVRDNHISRPRQLQPGSVISLPMERMRHVKLQAHVAYLRGNVQVRRSAAGAPPQALVLGDELNEGDLIEVEKQGFATLTLADGSRLLLSGGSRLRLQSLRDLPTANVGLADFVLEAGHVQADVQHQRPGSRFEVKTPMAITGVRGTHFGVGLPATDGAQVTDVTQGVVAVSPARWPSEEVAVAMGQGAVVKPGDRRPPAVRLLLPAPDLSAWPARVDTARWTAPAATSPAAAQGYEVALADAKSPEAVVFEDTSQDIHWGPVPDGVYEVSVRVLDADRVPGLVASRTVRVKTLPVAPFLQSPPNEQVVGPEAQSLVCTDVPGVGRYALQVSRDGDFKDVLETTISEQGCGFRFTPPGLGTYHWRAASLDAGAGNDLEVARGPWSLPSTLKVDRRPPVPEPTSEVQGNRVAVRWAGENADERFLVEAASTDNFTAVAQSQEVGRPEATLTLPLACSPYYVRVQSIAPNGLRSDFSPARILKTPLPVCSGSGTVLSGTGAVIRFGE